MNLDKYYSKTYNERSYNCAHFACDIWQELTGVDIRDKLTGMLTAKAERITDPKIRFSFKRLRVPESPCLIVMHRRRIGSHVGIYLNGKILHITKSGVERVSVAVATYGFDNYGFYK